jgi:hypothetical protein
MSRVTSIFGLMLVCALTSASQAALVTNGDFEAQTITDGGLLFTISDWTIADANTAFLYDPPADRMSSQGGDNNTVVTNPDPNTSVRQTLGITVANNSLYTLTVDVGADSYPDGAGTSYPLPPIGNGVSTGNLFTRLLANGGASPMPGFLSSNASVPSIGNFVTWTLVWQTGASEALAGTGIVVELAQNAETEAYFDNVSLTVTAVPEPASLSLLIGGSAAVMLRRRRRQR